MLGAARAKARDVTSIRVGSSALLGSVVFISFSLLDQRKMAASDDVASHDNSDKQEPNHELDQHNAHLQMPKSPLCDEREYILAQSRHILTQNQIHRSNISSRDTQYRHFERRRPADMLFVIIQFARPQ